MNCPEVVDLSSDDDLEVEAVKIEPGVVRVGIKQEGFPKTTHVGPYMYKDQFKRQKLVDNRNSNHSIPPEQVHSLVDDTLGISSTSPACPAPLCRQFWKAGAYNEDLGSKIPIKNGKNYLHVHPMFLHSNATSHKWAFGAIAELLDNAFDEINNGATYVKVDKISNPRDGSSMLLIQDDGGGLDPEAMRQCMSFGFSDKKSTSAIGQYGNGFKTSSMRLGADAIIFSRHRKNGRMTQSIGLLSYTFLTRTGHDRIVVPIVDYEINQSTGKLEASHGGDRFTSNISLLLKWSPYSTEVELLKQFDDVQEHGTKVIIYNLWVGEDGKLELDFDSDHKDIRIIGNTKKIQTIRGWQHVNEQHMANRLHDSLRVYLSILYLRVPPTFKIILRGKLVELHNVADDLKFPQYILYKPHCNGFKEGPVVTTIGFLKEAPQVNIHGFCVYHKNRLILPYWQVVNYSDSRGRGVVGALETDLVQPTHNKQDFERTSVFQKLEQRLRDMTLEYWDYHCQLIGYQRNKKQRLPSQAPSNFTSHSIHQYTNLPTVAGRKSVPSRVTASTRYPSATPSHSVGRANSPAASPSHSGGRANPPAADSSNLLVGTANPSSLIVGNWTGQDLRTKRKESVQLKVVEPPQTSESNNLMIQNKKTSNNLETISLMNQKKTLLTRCSEYEETAHKLDHKIRHLRNEIGSVQVEHDKLLAELKMLDQIKKEKVVKR